MASPRGGTRNSQQLHSEHFSLKSLKTTHRIHYLSEELRHDFDLLAACQQVGERHTGDAGHFHVIGQGHEFIEQSKRQEGIFEAVDGQAASALRVSLLKLGDDRVVHVLLLLAQKVVTDRVERVGTQLVVTQQNLKHSSRHFAIRSNSHFF